MATARNNADDYRARGTDFKLAWEILEKGCEIPPSLELFEQQLKDSRKTNPSLTVQGQARRLSEAYHRTQGFFGEDG